MIKILDSVVRDVRFTGRLFAARPGWTGAAILCLAIATGANTAAFTVVNGLLLRPLPFEHPDQLVMVALREQSQARERPFALREYRALAAESAGVAMLLARTFFPLSLSADDGAQMAQAELVSGNYFETLRVKPFAGRFFEPSADRGRGELQAVLSHALWRRRFGADLNVVGQSMRINGRPMVVAGIAPPGFVGAMQLIAADLWLPAAAYPDLAGSTDADAVPMFGVMGRLWPDVTVEQAQAQLTSVAAVLPRIRSARARAVMVTPAAGFGVPVAVQGLILKLSGFIYALMALLMTIASANVAALVLARGVSRSREVAVRLSLGASRWHIARQLLTESVALAVVGCAAGTVVALWLTQILVARLSTPFQYVSYAIDVHPDVRVFAYSAMVTALAVVLCGVAPIRYANRVDVLDVLKQSLAKGRSRQSRRTLNAIVVMQFALSTTLLVVAGIVVRSYVVGTQSTQLRFDTTGLIAATLDVGQVGLDRAAGISLYRQATERLSALPGATNVSLTRDLPFGSGPTVPVVVTDTPKPGEPVIAAAMVVSPDYFDTLGVALRDGRSFTNAEPARPRVAIVNESMARRLWPAGSPLGRVFGAKDGEPIEVIGIVPDMGEPSLNQRPQPTFYQVFPHEYSARMTILMRVHGNPGPFFGQFRQTIRDIQRDLSIVDLRTLDQLLDASAAQRRVPATILPAVGFLGLLLSVVGLYGVVAYGVRERAREIAIRLALGARPTDVRRLVLRQGFTIVAIGLTVGGVGALASAQAVRSHLFGISPFDPPTLAAVYAILLAAAFGALYLPARWASRLEPAQTLRGD